MYVCVYIHAHEYGHVCATVHMCIVRGETQVLAQAFHLILDRTYTLGQAHWPVNFGGSPVSS